MEYDDLIKMLKRNQPESGQPEKLTERILYAVRFRNGRNDRYFNRINPAYWPVFHNVRIVLTLAAAFLIIFFIFEQRQINARLKKLDDSIARVKYPELISNYHQVRYEKISKDLYQSMPFDSAKETLIINRRTLNFLISRIKELESENRSIQDKLNALYNDSLTIHTSKP